MTLAFEPAFTQSLHQSWQHMFHLDLPIVEKLIRPVIVYLVLVLLLRLFGKRELAQLNPFDLVVLLSLSNTVQNAIIGDDNSVSGGVIGAFSLLAINWVVARILYRSRKLTGAIEGHSTTLIKDGKPDMKALEHESLTMEELVSVVHKQGFANIEQVQKCQLEPNGTFYIEGFEPSTVESQHQQLLAKLDRLTLEIADLKSRVAK
jgi:uncharacterized membrane protein YcaP (DUF421 family)